MSEMQDVSGSRQIVTRKDAADLGLKYYWTGELCKNGHIAERIVSEARCVLCKHRKQGIYRDRHRPELREKSKKYYADNSEAGKATRAKWRANNYEKIRAREALVAEQRKEWREQYKLRPEVIERKNGRRATPRGNLDNRMSRAINKSLKTGKGGRSWQSLVGYTVDEFKSHIERQFTKGMGWHNRHLWHIDHIVPLSSFSFTSADDDAFKAAWALTNLRPLWASKNMSKGDKREFLL